MSIPQHSPCPICGTDLEIPVHRIGRLTHERGQMHRAAVAGHRLKQIGRPGYGYRWACGCGKRATRWFKTKSESWRGWAAHLPAEVPPIATVPKMPADAGGR